MLWGRRKLGYSDGICESLWRSISVVTVAAERPRFFPCFFCKKDPSIFLGQSRASAALKAQAHHSVLPLIGFHTEKKGNTGLPQPLYHDAISQRN